jgi:hypothetical protein
VRQHSHSHRCRSRTRSNTLSFCSWRTTRRTTCLAAWSVHACHAMPRNARFRRTHTSSLVAVKHTKHATVDQLACSATHVCLCAAFELSGAQLDAASFSPTAKHCSHAQMPPPPPPPPTHPPTLLLLLPLLLFVLLILFVLLLLFFSPTASRSTHITPRATPTTTMCNPDDYHVQPRRLRCAQDLPGFDGVPPEGHSIPIDPKDPSKGNVTQKCGTGEYVCKGGPG